MGHDLNHNNNNSERIALFISSPRIGGGERVMVDLANAFVRRGYAVDLLVLRTDGQYAHQLDERVRVVPLRVRRILLALPKLIMYLRREHPPVLLALDGYNHLLALAARSISGADTCIILRVGTTLSLLYKQYTLRRDKLVPWLSLKLYPKADAIIAVSEGVAHDVSQTCGVPREKITVIFNPKNIEKIRVASLEPVSHKWLGAHKTRPVIIAGGRLRAQKGFEDLFEAFALLNKKIPSRLIIVGPGGQTSTNKFAEQMKKLGITEESTSATGLHLPSCPPTFSHQANHKRPTVGWFDIPGNPI